MTYVSACLDGRKHYRWYNKEMSETSKYRVLVLGASGLLGQVLVPNLRAKGFDVISHGHQNSENTDLQCDATDHLQLYNILQRSVPDYIINLIALTNVDQCNQNVDLAYRLNVRVVENICKVVSGLPKGKCRLVQISTDHVYDKEGSASSEGETIMHNVYAISKFAGDLAAQRCESVVLRTNFFGPGRVKNRKSFFDAIKDTIEAGKEFYGFDDCFFNPLSAVQLSEEICRVMDCWTPGIYNLGAANGLSKFEFAKKVAQVCSLDESLVMPQPMATVSDLVKRPFNMVMNVSSYEAAFETKLPDIEHEIRRFGRNCSGKQT